MNILAANGARHTRIDPSRLKCSAKSEILFILLLKANDWLNLTPQALLLYVAAEAVGC